MLLHITNLPFDIRIARIRKLIADECCIDDVILDNLVNDNCGKRITVGLVDQEQASLVMAKINGYFIDGRKLQVEVVQKKIPQPQPLIKPFEQTPQPLLNNYNTLFPQPVNTSMNTFNAMPYYMAQQVSFGNTIRQPAPQAIPFPSFNKQNPSNWYAMNFGSQQYGVPIAQIPQSVQEVGIDLNAQKRSHDSESSGNPEKRQRGDADESFRSYTFEHGNARNDDPRLRSRSQQSRDHDRDDRSQNDDRHDRYDSRDNRYNSREDHHNSRDDRQNSHADHYNSRDDRHNSRDDRHNSRDDRYNSRDDRYNSRDDRYNSRDDRYNSRNDRHINRDDRHHSRDDRGNSHDDRRNSRDNRNDRRDNHNDNSRRHYDRDSFSNFETERSTFDNSNRNDNRRIVWEESPYKEDQRSLMVANTAPKPLFPHLANINNRRPQNKPQENVNSRPSFSNPQPLFNKTMQVSNKPQQLLNSQQSFNKAQSSNNAQKNYNNQQNVNKPNTSNKAQQNFNKNQQNFNKAQQKIVNPSFKRSLSRKEWKAVQFSALTEIHLNLAKKCDASQLALVKLKRLVIDRVKQIMEQHNCVSVHEVKEHYSRKYSIQNDRELKDIIRDNPKVVQAVSKNTAPQNIPHRQSNVPRASATSHAPPKANIPKVSKSGAPSAPALPTLRTVPTEQKLPKYPNADKNVYRELKKKEQLEAQEDFMYDVDKKYHLAIDHELKKMRDLAINACKETNNANTEKVRQEILKNGIDKVLKAMKQQVSKRLVNNFVGTIRIYFKYKPPKRPELEKFLKGYKVVSLKKSEKSKFFVATSNSSDGYDRLLALGSATIDGVDVTIKPLNVLGKPDKKAVLTKYQENVSNMAQKFKLKTKQQLIQTNQNKKLDESFSDVEIVDSKADEIVEINDDWDFSDDIIEIKDTLQSDTDIQKQKSQNVPLNEPESENTQISKQDTENVPLTEPESEDTQIYKQGTDNVPLTKPESEDTQIYKQGTENVPLTEPESEDTQIYKQGTENVPLTEPESEKTQISKQESVNPTQESDNKLCIAQESGATISNDGLKSEIISAIDDDDLEDF